MITHAGPGLIGVLAPGPASMAPEAKKKLSGLTRVALTRPASVQRANFYQNGGAVGSRKNRLKSLSAAANSSGDSLDPVNALILFARELSTKHSVQCF